MSRTLVIGVAGFLVSSLATLVASAHHEAWVLRDSGAQCSFTTPEGDWRDEYYGGLFNWAPYRRWMSCPVSLSARWASGPPNARSPGVWAQAATAAVYVRNAEPGAAFYCAAQAQMASGAVLFSRVVEETRAGDQRLMPNSNSNWGGALEAAKSQKLNSLELVCLVPPNGSGVYGTKVRMCIRTEGCVPEVPFGEAANGIHGGTDSVQTSGIACMAYNDDNLVRSELGATNDGPGHVSVVCPITPPADDTNEITQRVVRNVAVKYRVNSGSGEAPSCRLHSRMRKTESDWLDTTTDAFTSSIFVQRDPPFGQEVYSTDLSVGTTTNGDARADIALEVWCDLPPRYTLQGITADIDIPPVSQGP